MFNLSDNILIPLMVLLPLFGGLALAFLPQAAGGIRAFSLVNALLTFAVSLIAASVFDWTGGSEGMQLMSDVAWVEGFGLRFGFGVDAVSLWLVLLTTFLMPLVILGSYSAVSERHREFYLWLLVLEAAMIGTFVATDLIFFYICFEFTLIPLYFLIGIFGSTQRLKAARVFFIYTFTGSMLTFAGVLYVAWWNAQWDEIALLNFAHGFNGELSATAASEWAQSIQAAYPLLGQWSFNIGHLTQVAISHDFGLGPEQQMWVLLALLAGFAVKVPLFPLHTWLPLAHTEAPTAGSVILAGVLLKLGTYGLFRLALPMCPDALVEAAPVIGILAVAGILYTALICWVQKDIKKLIAYSSVSHLGFCVLGMMALNTEGVGGSVMYMINHGLSTGALFLCVGMIYERFHSRQIRDFGGLGRAIPVWSCFMVFFCLASVGLPGLNGFVGEFLTLMGTFMASDLLGPKYAVTAALGMILTAIYILYMVGRVVFGPLRLPAEYVGQATESGGRGNGSGVKDLSLREILTLLPLAAGCLWLGLFPTTVLSTLDQPIAQVTGAARSKIERPLMAVDVRREPPPVTSILPESSP